MCVCVCLCVCLQENGVIVLCDRKSQNKIREGG
jgi:hypothetical protein